MRKTYLAFLVLTLFSVSIFTSCKPSDDDGDPGVNPLLGTWVVGTGSQVTDESGTDVTSTWSSYSIQFVDATTYNINTLDGSSTPISGSGTYTAGNEGGNINLTNHETIVGYMYGANQTTLTFNQNSTGKNAGTITFTNLVKQ